MLAVAGLAGWLAFERWYANTLAASRQRVAQGEFAAALPDLRWLAWWRPGHAEVAYQLGLCERAAGRLDAAFAAWSRVPRNAPEYPLAALERARTEVDHGRFEPAEQMLREALGQRESAGTATLRHELIQLLYREGRLDEAGPLLEKGWEAAWREAGPSSPQALELLHAHRALDLEAYPVARVQEELDAAGRLAPDDPRVWLGRARLATRNGDLTEARSWLDRCLAAGDPDPPVWRAAIDLAIAADDLPLLARAAAELTTADLNPDQLDLLRIWSASRRADQAAEIAALDAALERNPANPAAIERRAELAAAAKDVRRSDELRRKKTRLDQTLRAYTHSLGPSANDPARTLELADQAEQLGRNFEARAFLLRIRGRNASRFDSARLDRLARTPTPAPSQPLTAAIGPLPGISNTPASDSSQPGLRVVDVAESAQVRFAFQNSETPQRQLPETMSGGVALLDFDGDGLLDLYAVQGGAFPPNTDDKTPSDRLFRNRETAPSEDVSDKSLIAKLVRGYGIGVAVADYNNDGHPDLFLTRWRKYQLLRNKGDGTFEDLTKPAGLDGDKDWPTSAAFADLDNDGDLDLYVCHYVVWNESNPRICRGEYPGNPDAPQYCAPHLLPHAVDHLFRNDAGRFVDVTREAGITDPDGRGLGVVATDLDDDGKVDLFVANDGTANFLFRNLGGFRFEEVAVTAGVAASAEGGYQAGMGVACGDVDGDGRLDLVVTNFYGESTSLYRSVGPGLFVDQSARSGLRAATRYRLGFGTALATSITTAGSTSSPPTGT
ncbi:MAG: FG-GAP-like repeat-containing protein [Isosphaeraceae bacterium]